MALLHRVGCVDLFVFTFISLSLARTNWYNLNECNTSRSIHSIEGAVVRSQDGAYYTTESRNCSVIFQTLDRQSIFLIQIQHVDIRKDSIFCRDHLSLTELYNLTSTSTVILDRFCGDFPQLPTPRAVYTRGGYLRLKWVTVAGSSSHHGFSISLTAISRDPEVCAAKGKFQCDNFTCIGQSLVCDGTPNCLQGEDEADCVISQLTDSQVASPIARGDGFTFSSMTTTPSTTVKFSAGSTTEQAPANEVYLWLPLIVVVIFTGIMVTLIMVGRRGEHSSYDRTSDDGPLLKLDGSIHHKLEMMHPEHEDRISEQGNIVQQAHSNMLHRKPNSVDVTSQGLARWNDRREASLNAAVATPTPPETTTRSHAMVPVYTKADLFLVTLALLAMLVMFACCAWIGCCINNTDDVSDLTASEVNLVDEHNRLQLEMNANAGYEHSEGMPETPPPTYDAIARQTSYVSHISQTSDQISIPPEYEEAVEWSNEHGRQRHSRLRHITRSRSTGRSASMAMSGSGSRGPNFARLFSRSVSATTGAPGVDRSGSATTPNTTTSTSDNNTTELSSVFVDTSPEIVVHPAPLPRPASHPLMSTPQTIHQGVPPCPSDAIGDDDVFDDSHQGETSSTQDSQNHSDNVHPSFFL